MSFLLVMQVCGAQEALGFPKQEGGTPLWMVDALPSAVGERKGQEAAQEPFGRGLGDAGVWITD